MYIEHAGIASRNPAQLADWYQKTLKMKLMRRTGETTFFVGYATGACIEIYLATEEREPTAHNYMQGMTHIALYTDDFENTYKALLEKGVRPAAEPVRRDDLKLALMRDPEGNLFHITSRAEPIIGKDGA